jgi:glycosyltransferase involved in cell wall biosynthesis
MTKIPCTVGILTKNSADTLERALESVKDFAEVIICDGGSTDATLEIAQRYNARIVAQNKDLLDDEGRITDFSGVRNQTLAFATNRWFLHLDSDEYLGLKLVEEIRSIIAARSSGAFLVLRRYVLEGKEVECAITYPNRSMRFFHKDSIEKFKKLVHERPIVREGVVPETLRNYLYVPVEPNRARVRERNDFYIGLEMRRKGKITTRQFAGYTWWNIKVATLYSFRLVRNYLFCRGTRLPFSMELGYFRYMVQMIAALWRARL